MSTPPHNEICDKLSRLGLTEAADYCTRMGITLIDVLPTSQWCLAERIRFRSTILPTDPPDRVKLIMQFAEKRIVREIPPYD